MKHTILTATVALCITAPVSEAQTVVPDDVTCSRCRIVVQDIVRLGPAGEMPTSPSRVVVDARGRYWLTFSNEPAMVYGPDGRFMKTLKQGKGPGEFEYPSVVLPVGDSILVLDDGSQRATILKPDLQIGRILLPSVAGGVGFVLSWPDSVLVHTTRLLMDRNMSPYHVVSFKGAQPRLVRSFGAQQSALTMPDARTLSQMSLELGRTIAPANDGGVWASNVRQYNVELWARSGELRRSFVRRPAWFPAEPLPTSRTRSLTSPPPPYVRALQQDEQGRLWVFIGVAAPTWREGYPQPGPGVREVAPREFANEKIFHTTIEVIDPAAGRVVVRSKLDNFIVSPLPGGRAAIYNTTTAGEPYVRIVQLSIAQR